MKCHGRGEREENADPVGLDFLRLKHSCLELKVRSTSCVLCPMNITGSVYFHAPRWSFGSFSMHSGKEAAEAFLRPPPVHILSKQCTVTRSMRASRQKRPHLLPSTVYWPSLSVLSFYAWRPGALEDAVTAAGEQYEALR